MRIHQDESLSSTLNGTIQSFSQSLHDAKNSTTEQQPQQEQYRELLLQEANFDPLLLLANQNPSDKKRLNYLSWEDYFMAVAHISAQRSKDPTHKVGACIVDEEHRIVGVGYNGFPRGCSDEYLPWSGGRSGGKGEKEEEKEEKEEGNVLHTKFPFMCHAEVNAILNKCSYDVKGAKMYVVEYPSNECAKIIIQSGIREIIYFREPKFQLDTYKASRIMFEMSGVHTRQYQTNSIPNIVLDFGQSCDETNNNNDNEDEDAEATKSTNGINTTNTSTQNNEKEKIKRLLQTEANYNIDDPDTIQKNKKSSSYLSWDDYFMSIAYLSGQRSKDPNTQVGACLVNPDKRIVGIGYNGFPRGCSDDVLPWSRPSSSSSSSSSSKTCTPTKPYLHTKYPYVVHAEVNAILNKGSADVVGSTLYVGLFPCNDCAKVIIQAGIREVVFLNDKYHDSDQCRASRIMFEMAGVKMRCYRPKRRYLNVFLGEGGASGSSANTSTSSGEVTNVENFSNTLDASKK